LKKWIIIMTLLAVGLVSIAAVMAFPERGCAVERYETAKVVGLECGSTVRAGHRTTAGKQMAATELI